MSFTFLESFFQYKQKNVEDTLSVLNGAYNRLTESPTQSTFGESVASIKEEIVRTMQLFANELQNSADLGSWDTLNVAFFGETNAGKSTVIDTLLRDTGENIGDGRKDYTKFVMARARGGIVLWDMPGIEGDEAKYREEIRHCVSEAHIVFYVVGNNKEPEETTLWKIKEYLKDQAKIYVIINVRGRPHSYRAGKPLVDHDIQSVSARTEGHFRRIFNRQFQKILVLNAHLAFLSACVPTREDFLQDQRKLEGIFGTHESVWNFSNFSELESLLDEHSDENYVEREMILSNGYKYLHEQQRLIHQMSREHRMYVQNTNAIKQQLAELVVKANERFQRLGAEISSFVNRKMNEAKLELKKQIAQALDSGESANQIERRIKKSQEEFSGRLQEGIKVHLHEFELEMKKMFDSFTQRMSLSAHFMDFNNINIEVILEKLKIDMKYVLKEIGSLLLDAVGVLLSLVNPVIAIIVGAIVVIKKIINWFFRDPKKRVQEAKWKAEQDVDEYFNKTASSVQASLTKKIKEMHVQFTHEMDKQQLVIRQIDYFNVWLLNIVDQLRGTSSEFTVKMVNLAFRLQSTFVYIDLQLNEAIIQLQTNELNPEALRLQKIYCYQSLGNFLREHKVEYRDNVFRVKRDNELMFRTLEYYCAYYAKVYPKHEKLKVEGV